MTAMIALATLLTTKADTGKVDVNQFNLFQGQNPVGTATYQFTTFENGNHELDITINLGTEVKVVVKGLYDPKNVWITKSMDANIQTRSLHFEAKMVTDGAQVQVPGDNGPQTKVLEPPAGLSLADPTLTWWKGHTPAVGEKATFAYFDLQKQVWQDETVVYVKDSSQTVGGQTYQVHEVTQTIGKGDPQTEYLDANGDPVLINGNPRFERKSAAS